MIIFVAVVFIQFWNRELRFRALKIHLHDRTDKTDREMVISRMIRKLEADGLIKYRKKFDYSDPINSFVNWTGIEYWFSDTPNLITMFRLICAWPLFFVITLPGYFLGPTILRIDIEELRCDDNQDTHSVDTEVKLIRKYDVKRKLTLSNARKTQYMNDFRPQAMGTNKLVFMDPILCDAEFTYVPEPGVRVNVGDFKKNSYKSEISLELFMQMTNPQIISLLDDVESVKFRANAYSKNFHAVNIPAFSALMGQDLVNTTLDAVFHYYRSRKFVYCSSCPDELFYSAPRM